MALFRGIPFQRKLRLVILATCGAALVAACAALFLLQLYASRENFKSEMAATAQLIGDYCLPIVSFNHRDEASALLSSLRARAGIVGASIMLSDGEELAKFGYTFLRPPVPTAPGWWDNGQDLLLIHPLLMNGERTGTLFIHADDRAQVAGLLRLYGTVLAVVLFLAVIVATVVSMRLERFIMNPIQALAATTLHIASADDYTVRAAKLADDEFGSFIDSFNVMLDHIQSRDEALHLEIAEHTRTEEKRLSLHGQLVDASRQAGMAEVATGVLHNVGNVLNSVNVSANLLTERLGTSRLPNLTRATELISSRHGSLGEFFTEDPKGRLLPEYLAEVSLHLQEERAEVLEELQSLTRNIDHIKDIVAMQQSYARVSGVTELLPVTELVEHALRLHLSSLEKAGVAVERAYDPVPLAAVDKHKVLQILVNLLRNAGQAFDEIPEEDRRIVLHVAPKDQHRLLIRVTDTGVGIRAENLTKIFSHGFTTRQEGHGFGLHSSALAAQEMGGCLTAHSEGPGYGASFTLELPLTLSPAGV